MTTTNTPCEKFQALLRELFQFDCADLDFGIYRIMNEKREVIEKFIEEDLPGAVAEKLREGSLADQKRAAARLAKATQEVREILGPDFLDGDGNLDSKYHDTPIGKRYLEAKAAGGRSYEALEADLFNHLYAFFSRYYQDGDFISKRRYSRRERYAIPYNGEEVYLHWANSDQYYVKTAEHFHDYDFKLPQGITVHFKLTAADVEQNSVKGDKRFFLPQTGGVVWEEERRRLVIPFEYRPLTQQESIAYGSPNQQDVIVEKALTDILEREGMEVEVVAALKAERRRNGDNKPVSFLEHHLRRYVQRNTSDFFIHKDLKSFLCQELDFYLKNEVLNLDEMQAAGEDRAEGWFQLVRTIKIVGSRIIEFLSQIERFQKMLWEKRKFVTEAQYCITIGNIDERFYSEMAECKSQWQEWQELFHIQESSDDLFSGDLKTKKDRIAFLKAHPTLVLDTKHFDFEFTDLLLGSMDNLHDKTDGLLVYSENWQALNLLAGCYREQVKCVYIDPPYNSPSSRILYKNDYLHSSWLALINNRLDLSACFLDDGVYVIAIDENEQERLGLLVRSGWLGVYETVCVAVRHNPRGIQGMNFSHCHEYAYFMYPSDSVRYIGERLLEQPDIRNLRDSGLESNRTDARNCFYPFFVENGIIVDVGDVPADDYHPSGVNEPGKEGVTRIWPIDTSGNEKKWRYARQSVERILPKLQLRKTRGKYEVYFAKDTGTVRTIWDDAKFDASEYGTKLLQEMFGTKNIDFSYPKSLYTLVETIRVALQSSPQSTVLDYFAGSGTTGHAVIELNREDGANRRFLLAEMGHYFDTVLLPRIKKVTFAPEWKDGKPKRMATREEVERSPRIVKYLRLESYEDALNNIAFDHPAGQEAMEFDDYLLKYMLAWETKRSETLLNVGELARPFDYKLRAQANGRAGERAADVPETFNYLLGLRVRTRQVHDDGGRRYLVYRGEVERRQVVVIWRDNEDWREKDLKRDKEFVAERGLAEGADEVFVNGDSFIPGARSLDPVFKDRMFAPVEG